MVLVEVAAKWVNAKLTLAYSTPLHPWRGLKPGLEAQTASPPCSQCCMQCSFTVHTLYHTLPKHYTSHQGLAHIASILSLHEGTVNLTSFLIFLLIFYTVSNITNNSLIILILLLVIILWKNGMR